MVIFKQNKRKKIIYNYELANDQEKPRYNTETLKKSSMNYLVKNLTFSDIEYVTLNKISKIDYIKDINNFIDELLILAKKDNYEIVFIILLLEDLIKKKGGLIHLMESLIEKKIETIENYIKYFKIVFSIISLIIGKYYDDLAMINSDYLSLINQLIIDNKLTLSKINKIEGKILNLIKFHFKIITNFEYKSDFILKHFPVPV